MTRTAYLENALKAYEEGRISAEAYDSAVANAPEFIEDEPSGGYYIGKPYQFDDLYNGLQDEPF